MGSATGNNKGAPKEGTANAERSWDLHGGPSDCECEDILRRSSEIRQPAPRLSRRSVVDPAPASAPAGWRVATAPPE